MSPELPTLHFPDIQPAIDGLIINVERDLHRRVVTERESARLAQGLVVLRISVLTAKNLYNAIRWLCADEEAPGRKPEYALVVPCLNRPLIEILLTVMYLLEDLPGRSEFYNKAGWREHNEELHKYKTAFSGRKEWGPFFESYKQMLSSGASEFKLTEDEKNDPKGIEYWKSGYQLIDRMGPENRPFARWLDRWFYHETSAIAHFDPYGLTRIAMFLVADMAPEGDQDQVRRIGLPRFRAFHISITIILLLCIASELEHALQLQNKAQIVTCWEKVRKVVFDADEICRHRYDAILGMQPSFPPEPKPDSL